MGGPPPASVNDIGNAIGGVVNDGLNVVVNTTKSAAQLTEEAGNTVANLSTKAVEDIGELAGELADTALDIIKDCSGDIINKSHEIQETVNNKMDDFLKLAPEVLEYGMTIPEYTVDKFKNEITRKSKKGIITISEYLKYLCKIIPLALPLIILIIYLIFSFINKVIVILPIILSIIFGTCIILIYFKVFNKDMGTFFKFASSLNISNLLNISNIDF